MLNEQLQGIELHNQYPFVFAINVLNDYPDNDREGENKQAQKKNILTPLYPVIFFRQP